MRKLFDILVTSEDALSPQECSMMLYGKPSMVNLERLVRRLQVKILDSLLIDINTDRMATLPDKSHFMQVRLRKQLLQYFLLRHTKVASTLGRDMLKKIFYTASMYELYGTCLEVLTILKATTATTTKKSQYEDWNAELELYENKKAAYHRAFDFFNRYKVLFSYQGKLSAEKHLEFLTGAIDQLKTDYTRYNSPTSGYFCGVLETAYYEQRGDFKQAIAISKSLIPLIEANPSIRFSARVATQYQNIAIMEFQTGNLPEALISVRKSNTLEKKGSLSQLMKSILEMEILYYMDQFDQAAEICRQVQTEEKTIGEVAFAKSQVFLAAIEFRLQRYKEALNILNQKFALSTDKAGWELSVRVLRLLTLIEMGKEDEAETSLNNIERFVQRYNKKLDVTVRDKEIMRFLSSWSKSSFSFEDYSDKTFELATKISTSAETEWKFGTPELIPVDEWFLNKVKKKRGPKPGKKTKSNA
ncbi:MAG TPA: hypothetical protein VK826_08015 [Bacteroidia bacterium]|nr:hypothetical protein [Bacteroidia bacterium]